MKPDRDFKISIIYLFGIPDVGVSTHATKVSVILLRQGWGNYQINDVVIWHNFKGSDYSLPQGLKVLESRGGIWNLLAILLV